VGGGTELVAAEAATASALGAIATVGGNGSKNAVVAVEQRREESQDASEELSRGLAVWRDLGGSMRQLPHVNFPTSTSPQKYTFRCCV